MTGYPDIAELFLVTDVLITDYSSVMFDFAVTGRPMLFFTYDLEQYRDQLRGFYFDFEAEAPGPLLATSDEVLAAVRRHRRGRPPATAPPTRRSPRSTARWMTARPARGSATGCSLADPAAAPGAASPASGGLTTRRPALRLSGQSA